MPYAAAVVFQPAAPNVALIASREKTAVGDMRAFLATSKPQSPSEALRLLRKAYPEAPLSLRVAACGLSDMRAA